MFSAGQQLLQFERNIWHRIDNLMKFCMWKWSTVMLHILLCQRRTALLQPFMERYLLQLVLKQCPRTNLSLSLHLSMNRLAQFQLFDISKTGGLNLSPLEPIQAGFNTTEICRFGPSAFLLFIMFSAPNLYHSKLIHLKRLFI